MDTTQTGMLSDDELRAIDDSHNWQTTEGRFAAYRAIIAKLQATQAEPVQAGELPDDREAFEAWYMVRTGSRYHFSRGIGGGDYRDPIVREVERAHGIGL